MPKGWAAQARSVRWLAAGIVAVVLGLAVIWVLFVPAADWLAHHDVGSVKGSLHETAVDNARGRLLTLGAGLFAAGALVFTARNFTLSRHNSEQADQWQRRTHELTEQGQVTDRYTKAIEQLGSDKLDVRIGGVYALERVARDSARDHPTVMEVLTAFIREHSHEQWPPSGHPTSRGRERSIRPDVQAALTVIGRRDPDRDVRSIDLAHADLTAADLTRANLGDADLTRAILPDANLTRADLTGANLGHANLARAHVRDANLTRAFLGHADLTGANLGDADLTRAILPDANLTRAYLRGAHLTRAALVGAHLADANLTRADFTGAFLAGADLTGADLTGATLTRADFTGARLTSTGSDGVALTGALLDRARWPAGAPLPPGWELDPGSGLLKRPSAGSTPAEAD